MRLPKIERFSRSVLYFSGFSRAFVITILYELKVFMNWRISAQCLWIISDAPGSCSIPAPSCRLAQPDSPANSKLRKATNKSRLILMVIFILPLFICTVRADRDIGNQHHCMSVASDRVAEFQVLRAILNIEGLAVGPLSLNALSSKTQNF